MAHVEHQITVGRPVEEVFSYLADGERLIDWMSEEFAQVKKISDGPVGKGTTYRYVTKRSPVDSTWEWVEFEPHRRLAWHGRPVSPVGRLGSVEPMGGYTLEPVDGGTRVRAVIEPRLRGVIKLFEPLFTRSRRKSWATQLETMKRILESGGAAGKAV